MRNDCQAVCICHRQAQVFGFTTSLFRRFYRAGLPALAALQLMISGTASAQLAYAMQFNQGNNSFGTINLLTGGFTQLGTEGGTLFNDIAASPDGLLYGIINTTSLVTINTNNGAVASSVNFSVPGIESLAMAPDGSLYGATQGALYLINPIDGSAMLIGNFNNSILGNSGQNIRFGYDGNLYDTDGGVNATSTHLFQISILTGQATLMGTVTNFPGLCLENAGAEMYGVGIQLGAASTLVQSLVGIDLNTLVPGGTNPDGSDADIGYELLTGNFPNNYNFSSADLFVVPGSILPVPEPAALTISVTGGLILLLVTRKRLHC